MYTFKAKKGTWHHRLAYTYTKFWYASDFCQYVQHVLAGICVVVFSSIVIGFVLGCMASGVIAFVDHGWAILTLSLPGVQEIGLALWFVVALLGIVSIINYIEMNWPVRPYKPKPYKEPGFLTHAVEAIFNKACFRVSVERNSEDD